MYEQVGHVPFHRTSYKAEFQKLLDMISPFYQDRLKELAPQERALLETLALMRREPRTPANIARKMRKSPQQISSLLQRMTKAGYLVAIDNPEDRRSKLYRIKEGFFDLWLAMSESRQQRRYLGYLVDFFSQYYADKVDLEQKRQQLWQILQAPQTPPAQIENHLELLGYLSEVGAPDEQVQTKIELAAFERKAGHFEQTLEVVRDIERFRPTNEIYIWAEDRLRRHPADPDETNAEDWLEKIIDYWRMQRGGELEKAVETAQRLGVELAGEGLHRVGLALLQEALENTPDRCKQIPLLRQIARSHFILGELDQATERLNTALQYAGDCRETSEEAKILLMLVEIVYFKGDFQKALEQLESATAKAEKSEDYSNVATAKGWKARIFLVKGDVEGALKLHREMLQVFEQLGDKRERAVTLGDIARIFVDKGDVEEALKLHRERLQVFEQLGDQDGIANSHWSIAQINLRRKEFQNAFEALDLSYRINLKLGRLDGICFVGLDLGKILCGGGQREEGLKVLRRSEEGFRKLGRTDLADQTAELIRTIEDEEKEGDEV